MSILNHENLVNIIECDTLEDGSAYIVMEFIPGETLEDVRLAGPVEDWMQVVRWGAQMCAGPRPCAFEGHRASRHETPRM
jgi:serine/threonine protein kinase